MTSDLRLPTARPRRSLPRSWRHLSPRFGRSALGGLALAGLAGVGLMGPGLVGVGLTGAASAQACAPAPDPVLTLGFESRYTDDDPTRATLDEAAEAAAKAAVKPLDDFIRDLAAETDRMLATADASARAALADCLLARMGIWARQDALAGLTTQTVRLTIGSRLSAFGLVALQAQENGSGTRDAAEVGAWLQRRMREQMTFWETAPSGARVGNLRLWAALAGAATSALTDDPLIRGWAAWSTTYVTCTANPDGSLPREMDRGRRALHYQLHALAPMVTATLLLERQGMPVLAACGDALDRAVGFALDDLESGARSHAITGEVQTLVDGSDPLEDFQLAWIDAFLALEGAFAASVQAERWAAPRRPLSYSKLGGNQTLMWGR